MWDWMPRQKPLPFNEEQIRVKAYELWRQRGSESSTEENWRDAIQSLERERSFSDRLAKSLQTRIELREKLSEFSQKFFPNFYLLWRWSGIGEKKGVELLQLLAGISIPVLLFLATQYFNTQQKRLADNKAGQDSQLAAKRAEQDHQLADDKANQETWVKYLDQMAKSLEDGLLEAKPGDKEFIIAQARTVTALQSLDKKRQSLLIQYLTAAGLNHASKDLKKDKNDNVLLRTGDRVLLYRARMAKVDLKNSDLSGAVLIGADLSEANLDCVPLDSKERSHCSDLSGAVLSGANLRNANLRNAVLSDADLRNAHLSEADLNGADLRNAHLNGADLIRADLRNADLNGADLNGADLRNAHLNGADLIRAVLIFANLAEADLSEADLFGAHLSGADLSNAHLNGADLFGADLSNAYLNGADLFGADLSGADLSGADLSEADLSGAVLIRADLRSTRELSQLELEGENHPLLCNVVLPKEIKVDRNRDCNQLPQALVAKFPTRFSNIEDAKRFVDNARQKKWE